MTIRATADDNRAISFPPIFAAVWLIAFLALFFDQQLPNNPSVNRLQIAGSLLDSLLGTADADPPPAVPSGWQFLKQRGPIALQALLLLGLAWLPGAALGRFLLPPAELSRTERFALQLGLGLSVHSLAVLTDGRFGRLDPPVLCVPAAAALVSLLIDSWRHRQSGSRSSHRHHIAAPATSHTTLQDHASASHGRRRPGTLLTTRLFEFLMAATIAGAVLWLILGAMSPPTDFDVREYHLQGPKEWYQAGRITCLPHNVYTSFPFLSEMLSLSGMVIAGDWWHGALVGKTVLACFAPLTAVLVFSIGRRLVDAHIGLLAALLFVTTPWTVRISIIAYAEGALTFYLTATVWCLVVLVRGPSAVKSGQVPLLCGLLAGSAMSCKYTGLVSAVLPAAAVICTLPWRPSAPGKLQSGIRLSQVLRLLVTFSCGVLVSVGPWLLRNFIDTGNPVYPLGWSVFGGRDWDAVVNERWKAAHRPGEHLISNLPQHALDVAVRNDWTSPLLFGLAVPAILLWRRIPGLPLVAILVIWQFAAWWGFTHRIDRFWVPVIPLLAVLAAAARRLSAVGWWRWTVIAIVFLCTLFNLRFVTLPLVGYHAGLQDLTAARQLVIRSDLRQLNTSLPKDAVVLMVGEAEVFDCRFRLRYNTVFDQNIFESLTADPSDRSAAPHARRLKSAAEIRSTLQSAGITHLFVNWAEILRYRLPGSYGYAEYVQPARLSALIEQEILSEPATLLSRPWDDLTDQEQTAVDSWTGSELIHENNLFASTQLFTVK